MIQELVNRADQRGYLIFDDILEVLEEHGDDVSTSALEAILYEIDEIGIEIRKEADSGDDVNNNEDDNDIEFTPEEMLKDPNVGDISAVSADDPVGLYFRQMAKSM